MTKVYTAVYANNDDAPYVETFKTPEGALRQLLEDVAEYTDGDQDSIEGLTIQDCEFSDNLFCVYDDYGFYTFILETELQ